MVGLQDFFDNPHKIGYVRFPTDEGCYYIKEEEFKKLLLEDLESVKYKEMINGE